MKCEWKRIRVGDLGTIITGKTPPTKKAEYWGGNIHFITPKDLQGTKHVLQTDRFITGMGLESVRGCKLPSDAVCVSCIGNIGYVAMTRQTCISNQQINSIIANENYDPDFVYYLMKSLWPFFKNYEGQSTTLSILNKTQFSKIEIVTPDLPEQKKIASILSSLDDKIELNNKINENLQQQAQAIFRSLFLDYLPFNSIKPTYWKFCTLGETTKMSAGGDKPKGISNIKSTEYPYPIYSNGLDNEGLYGYTNEAKIFAESVTVSARGTIGFVCLRHIPYVPIVRLVTLIPNEDLISAKYLYLYLKQLHISGTGTTQQQLTVPDFRKTEILIPDKITMDKFTNLMSPMFNQIWANEEENIKLASLRDSLLPKLMSGEIEL